MKPQALLKVTFSFLFMPSTISAGVSHTEGLIQISKKIMEKNGIVTELLRPVDFDVVYGVQPDMKEHRWKNDDWPGLLDKVMASDILAEVDPAAKGI